MKSQLAQTIATLETEREVIDLMIKKLKALARPPVTRVAKPRLVVVGV
jgi:hypothetical protein